MEHEDCYSNLIFEYGNFFKIPSHFFPQEEKEILTFGEFLFEADIKIKGETYSEKRHKWLKSFESRVLKNWVLDKRKSEETQRAVEFSRKRERENNDHNTKSKRAKGSPETMTELLDSPIPAQGTITGPHQKSPSSATVMPVELRKRFQTSQLTISLECFSLKSLVVFNLGG